MSQPKPTFVERVGLHTGCPGKAFGLLSDGNVWSYGVRLDANHGALVDFLRGAVAGRWRVSLDPKYAEMASAAAPEGWSHV